MGANHARLRRIGVSVGHPAPRARFRSHIPPLAEQRAEAYHRDGSASHRVSSHRESSLESPVYVSTPSPSGRTSFAGLLASRTPVSTPASAHRSEAAYRFMRLNKEPTNKRRSNLLEPALTGARSRANFRSPRRARLRSGNRPGAGGGRGPGDAAQGASQRTAAIAPMSPGS